jgi:hypothetical protein
MALMSIDAHRAEVDSAVTTAELRLFDRMLRTWHSYFLRLYFRHPEIEQGVVDREGGDVCTLARSTA